MNKKRLILILISIILIVALVLGGILIFSPSKEETAEQITEKIDALRLTVPDEILLDTDFSEFTPGSLPDGWDKTFAYPFLNDGNKTTSLQSTGGNSSHVTVTQFADLSYLGFSGRDGEHILTSSPVGSENYIVTATVNFSAFKTPFGIVTDISDDYKSTEGVTLLTVSGEDIDKNATDDVYTYVPTFKVSHRTKGDKDFVGTDKAVSSVRVADIDRSAVTITDSKTGEGTIANDTDIVITTIHYNNVSYFYLNDKLIASVDDKNKTGGSRFGFFSDPEGREVKVKNLFVASVKDAAAVLGETAILATATNDDFTKLSALDESYKLYSGQWLDKATRGTAEIKNGGLNITAKNGATAIMLPVMKNNDYHFSAQIKFGGTDGSFGLITCVADPLSGSRGGNLITLSADKSKVSLYTLTVKKKSDIKEYKIADIPNLTLSDKVKIDVYCYGANGYYFVNDLFVGYQKLSRGGKNTEFCGIYSEGCSEITVLNAKTDLLIKKESCSWLKISETSLSIDKNNKVTATVSADLSKNNVFSQTLITDGFDGKNQKLGIICAPSSEEPSEIKIGDKGVTELKVEEITTVAASHRATSSLELTSKNISDYFTFRGYVSITEGDKTTYYYGIPQTYSPAADASGMYLKLSSKQKEVFDTLFKDRLGYIGKYEKTLTFTLFSDFHYKQGMYSTSVADMQAILDRANKSKSEFLLSAGDFCNDFEGSPELMNAFLENNYSLPVYNVYGNHELEAGNNMSYVTPLLTNDKDVIWGTKDGKIGDGSIAYYYFDHGDFRIVCTDTNYSFNPSTQEWEHNYTGSYGPPSGNTNGNSLGPVQLEWLEKVLLDGARTGKSCIVIGHDSFAGKFRSTSPDALAIREIYSKANGIRKGTVLLSINGHIHTNNMAVVEDVLYIDMNTTRNGVWRGTGTEHYSDKHTFDFVEYDSNGNPISTSKKSLNELTMGKNTWFFEDPLSATVKVSQYGTITVEGMESRWIYGINPADAKHDEVPKVSSGSWELLKK